MMKTTGQPKLLVVLVMTSCQPLPPDDDTNKADPPLTLYPPGDCSPDCGPTLENFFDNTQVATLNLDFDPDELAKLGSKPDDWEDLLWDKWYHCGPYHNYVPVRMSYEDPRSKEKFVVNEVGIRFRGGKGKGDARAGFKIDIQEFIEAPRTGEKKRRFADLNRINLLSLEKDKAVMSQCMGYTLMGNFGVPAPRCNHLRVYINGSYYGLMENVEEPDDGRYFRHHFGENEGTLFAASHGCGYPDHQADLKYLGESYTDGYDQAYEMLRGDESVITNNFIPMLRCGDQRETPDENDFRKCISEWINLEQWLHLIAGESLAPALESFTGARRNYYLYFHPDSAAPHGGRFAVYSWDYDHTLQRGSCSPENCDPFSAVPSWWAPLGKRSDLVTRLTQTFHAEYCLAMQQFVDEILVPEAVDQMAAVIEPAMRDDPDIAFDIWQTEVEEIRTHVTSRRLQIQNVIDDRCQGLR